MNLLAIEAATDVCSVALLRSGQGVMEQHHIGSRRHAEHLLPMVDTLLADSGVARQALDGIAVGSGPGAFTGVRLAVSLAQGMALALNRPLVTVSSLLALALEAPDDDDAAILAVMDARMDEIYAASYRRDRSGRLRLLDREQVCKADALILPAVSAWHVVGNGWLLYGDVLRSRLTGTLKSVSDQYYPRACQVAALAIPEFDAGRSHPPALAKPMYLRDKVALTLRERVPN